MTTRTRKNPRAACGTNPKRLWYAPDRRVRTDRAARQARQIAEWIEGRARLEARPDEHELFVALHACAFRAGRPARGQRGAAAGRERWARRWQTVRDYIVEHNLGLVHSMVGRYGARPVDQDDLLSEAMIGLTRAVERFNPWLGYRFSTYACNAIGRAIMRIGKREARHREMFPAPYDPSLEQPEASPDPQTELYAERLNRALDGNLGELTDLETEILAQRFPRGRHTPLTYQEIGETVGLSKERIRQIQNVALRKLREVLEQDPMLQ